MNRFFLSAAALAVCLTPALRAQSLAGPTQGVAFDAPSQSLRAVVGSFGAAVLGPALLGGLDFASAAPQGGRAVGCQRGQCFLIDGLGTDFMGRTPIADQIDTPDAAAWSWNGQVVAIYSRSGSWIRVLQFAGEAGSQQSLSPLGGQLVDVAVSPDGKRIVFAIAGDHSGVFELLGAGTFVPVFAAEHPVGLAYAASGDTLYVLDGSRISSIGGDGISRSWTLDAVEDSVGVQAGTDGEGRAVLYVAGREDRALFVYDATTHNLIEQIALNFAPSQLQPAGAGSYLLTSRTSEDELLWSYTAGRGAFFVPAPPTETSGLPQRKVRR